MKEIKCPGDCTDTGCCAPEKPQPVIIEFVYDEKGKDRSDEVWSVLDGAVKNVTNVLNSSGLYIETVKTPASSKSDSFASLPQIIINGQALGGSGYTEKQLMAAVMKAVYASRTQ